MGESEPNPIWRRDVLAWCCYDWANSGYTTLLITVFVVYLQRFVFGADSWGDTGAIVWAWGVSASMLVGAVLSPILGALADAHSSKRFWLSLTAMAGGAACIALALVPPQSVWVATSCFLVANICLELSLTVYNGFLPEIANDDEMNRVSAAGMGWGYFGGGLALLIAMLLLSKGELVGLGEMQERLRWCIALTGVWWGVFSLPTVLLLRDQSHGATSAEPSYPQSVKLALGEAIETLHQIRRYGPLALFLVAFLFFNDGVQTVISQSSTFALEEIHFTESELVGVILMVQFLAVPGAIVVGWLADRFGQKETLIGCLFVWIGLLVSAWFIRSKAAYWLMAVGVAMVLGGTQAISRAVMGVLTPKRHAAKFFGFFNLSGKATSFMGTFVFGLTIAMTGNSRIAVVVLIVFFVVGLAVLLRVKLPKNEQNRASENRPMCKPDPTTPYSKEIQ